MSTGVAIANRVAPGKRPRSSMAPTVVLRDGAPVLAIGSPGGSQAGLTGGADNRREGVAFGE
jgi:gamma-glutamyltranspeptidase/glutathione hydrolase